jgi:hypothetical protein
MRLFVSDREPVDSDELDAAIDQELRPLPVEARKLLRELVLRPELRVRCLEEDACRILGSARHILDGQPFGCEDDAGAQEHVQR